MLKQPAGILLVILAGCIVLGIAVSLFRRAYRATFMRSLKLSSLSVSAQKGVRTVGRWGNAALGVVFALIGFFLIIAAIKHNPRDAKGLDAALIALLKQPFGPWLLGVVALGLLAYGVYSFIEARSRKVGG